MPTSKVWGCDGFSIGPMIRSAARWRFGLVLLVFLDDGEIHRAQAGQDIAITKKLGLKSLRDFDK